MTLHAVIADITRLEVEAIVNAANEQLAPGGGVCGAIHRAAGPRLAEACRQLGGCPIGEARLTPGFDLSARWVIHAVGPRWQGGDAGEAALLASAYSAALELAAGQGCRSVAFPAISTGIFGYPLGAATAVALVTTREFLERNRFPTKVIFACFSEEALAAYREAGVPA